MILQPDLIFIELLGGTLLIRLPPAGPVSLPWAYVTSPGHPFYFS
jgi:hypothetical protein